MAEVEINKEGANGSTFQTKDLVLQRSELMEEIVSNKPGFLIRWGNLVFLLVLILIGIACWFIKYPDTIQAPAKLTSLNAPKPVVCLAGGKLIKLNIEEGQWASKGQIVASIESTGKHEEVLKVAASLDTIQQLLAHDEGDGIKKYFLESSEQLGELQTSYQSLSQAFLSFNNYLADGFYMKKKAMLEVDRENLKKLYSNLIEQSRLQEQDLALVQKTFDANQSLNANKVISDFDYRLEKSKLINKKLSLPQIKSAIIGNQSQQADKEKEILELQNAINQQRHVFQQSLNTFASQLEQWLMRYTLIAPMEGKVVFATFLQENLQLQANQVVCYINPEDSQYFAEITIPQSNFGKVAVGQLVLLKFESYPFHEFGSVMGSIDFISRIPGEKGYLAKVILTEGLVTTYQKQVQYRDGLLANAEIITKDMRLLERFYYNLVQQMRR